jgi:hypothetical protein
LIKQRQKPEVPGNKDEFSDVERPETAFSKGSGMAKRSMVSLAILFAAVSMTSASAGVIESARAILSDQIGTPDQRREAIAACGYDARRFCSKLKEADGPFAYLACLETNKSQLTMRCVNLLARYGQ